MSVTITVRLSDSEAKAVLRSEGFHNGWGVRNSQALHKAEMKIIGAVQDGWNAQVVDRLIEQDAK